MDSVHKSSQGQVSSIIRRTSCILQRLQPNEVYREALHQIRQNVFWGFFKLYRWRKDRPTMFHSKILLYLYRYTSAELAHQCTYHVKLLYLPWQQLPEIQILPPYLLHALSPLNFIDASHIDEHYLDEMR